MKAIQQPYQNFVQSALNSSVQPEVRRVIVDDQDDHVEVYGRVSSYYMKSLAIEAVKTASGGRPIVVHIEVLD